MKWGVLSNREMKLLSISRIPNYRKPFRIMVFIELFLENHCSIYFRFIKLTAKCYSILITYMFIYNIIKF